MLTLWDLLPATLRPVRFRRTRESLPKPTPPIQNPRSKIQKNPRRPSMQDRYDAMAREQLELHSVRVRRYRSAMTGIAWQVRYRDGTVRRLIEAPKPRGPMSAAIFLHEIGHHAIGFDVYKPRCLEEYHAWAYSIAQMERYGLSVTEGVRKRMHNSLWYAVDKARRRGIKAIPPELEPFVRRIK